MRRPVALLGLLALGASVLFGCRTSTVSVAFTAAVDAVYDYRYEIVGTVTRTVEDQPPEVTRLDTRLEAEQRVVERTPEGARIRLQLAREGGVARTAIVLVDRAGSLEGVELVQDLDAEVFGVATNDALVPTHLGGPPDRPLAPGDTWDLEDQRDGSGRLERLGVVDGVDVAVVRIHATDELTRTVRVGEGRARVSGTLRSGARTSYDLTDGAIRRSRSWSRGTFEVVLLPPRGVLADPVPATIEYDVSVRVTRAD
jgi:hypothetical protein